MNTTELKERRGELMAELFLQEFEPNFVARPTADDFAFDFLVGFTNAQGGLNTFAVEVKTTEKPTKSIRVRRELFNRLTHSNIPLILLIVDVKGNQMSYAWLNEEYDKVGGTSATISIPLTALDEIEKKKLRERMAGS